MEQLVELRGHHYMLTTTKAQKSLGHPIVGISRDTDIMFI